MKKNVWVTKHQGDWGCRMEGDDQDLYRFSTQQEAISAAREKAREAKVELIIQGKDGAIREKNSYGNDPARSRG